MEARNKASQQAADQKLQTGIKQYLTSAITVAGTLFTATQLGTVIQGRIDSRTATDVAAATYRSKVTAQAASIAGSKVLLAQARAVLLVMFASSPEVLAAMGLSEARSP